MQQPTNPGLCDLTILGGEMVLLGRFELPASPLPRECSTPELQQRNHMRGPRCFVARRGYCHSHAVDASQKRNNFESLTLARAQA
jgi:hypothetical protein